MPKHTLPKEKKSKRNGLAVSSDDSWNRRIQLPVNQEILDAVKTGDKVTVTLIGEIEGTRDQNSKDFKEKNITLNITSVDVMTKDEEKAKSEEDFKRGYKNNSKKY